MERLGGVTEARRVKIFTAGERIGDIVESMALIPRAETFQRAPSAA